MTKVWIDQDLCTGDGLCAEICPEIFFGQDDGLYYVQEPGGSKKYDGKDNPAGAAGQADVPDGMLESVIEAAEECPGECIFIEIEG